MRRCLITFCPANHKMNRMVMVITEDSDLITVTPQGDGNFSYPSNINQSSGFNYRYPARGRKRCLFLIPYFTLVP